MGDILFQQLFEPLSSTYTYIIADRSIREAAIIDPVAETFDRDLKMIEEMDVKIRYILETHIHADHVTSAARLRSRTGARTAVCGAAGVRGNDIGLQDGDELNLGSKKIRVIATPGHTKSCLSYFFDGLLFTGDALLIRGCGRTDFQDGDSAELYRSVREKLFIFPAETMVYPAHDYQGRTSTTIGTERRYNPRLKDGVSLSEFSRIMSELKLPPPKQIEKSVPANLRGGATDA